MAAEPSPAAAERDGPIAPAETRALFDALAPFERQPHVAVAVSGGADSMALCLLAHEWLRRRGGRATALIVDHRLRPESTAEARRVAGWLAARGIDHAILAWQREEDAAGNLQARTRAARYRLLSDWCRGRGVLHLLVGHHREDQAETLLIRLDRGSGGDGLAGMPAIAETPALRVLRPLLDVPRARLTASLRQRRQAWIDDPSNLDDRFLRTRVRALLAAADGRAARVRRLADTARRLARARVALERATARLLARAVAVHPAGFALVDRAALAAADDELALRGLGRVLTTVGGADYPPRLERLERLLDAIRGNGLGRGRTLGGCRILTAHGGDRLLVCREPAAAAADAGLRAGRVLVWDGRFRVACAAGSRGLRVGALGRPGQAAVAEPARLRLAALPAAARPTLPVLRDDAGILAIPHVAFVRPGTAVARLPALRFAPPRPLAATIFR